MLNPDPDRPVAALVLGLMGTGSMLCELVADLIDALTADAYPGEDQGSVIGEMQCGSIAVALDAVEPEDVRAATTLIDLARGA